MFTHELAPVAGSLTVSALIALLPLITIFILLGVVRIKAHWAGLASLVVAVIPRPRPARPTSPRPSAWRVRAGAPTKNVEGSSSIRIVLPYNSGPCLTRLTVSCSDLTAVSTGRRWRASGHAARRNPCGRETYPVTPADI